jgi:penicillin-binding protein 1A
MALGAGNATPLQMATAYSVFANGGFRITPYLIDRIVDGRENILAKTTPAVAGEDAEQAIDPRNAFVMTTLLRGTISIPGGTGGSARSLGRQDLAGKTGTTNDHIDAWFCGFNHAQVGIAWIGFDQPRTLGPGETGGASALPIWIGYMGKTLKGIPEKPLKPPAGVIAVGGDYFLQEFPPREAAPLPLLPTQVPPSEASSALPAVATAPPPNAPSVVLAPTPASPSHSLPPPPPPPGPPPPPPPSITPFPAAPPDRGALQQRGPSAPPDRNVYPGRSPFSSMDRAQ